MLNHLNIQEVLTTFLYRKHETQQHFHTVGELNHEDVPKHKR